jgi:hypothetical protein
MITTEEISKIRQKVTGNKKKNQITADTVAKLREIYAPQTIQKSQPTTTQANDKPRTTQPIQSTQPIQNVQNTVQQPTTIKSHAGVAQANDKPRTTTESVANIIQMTRPNWTEVKAQPTNTTSSRFDGLTQDEIVKKVNEELASKNTISNNVDKILNNVEMKEATPYKDALNNLANAEMSTGVGLVNGLVTKAIAENLPEGVIRNYISGLSDATGSKAVYKYLKGAANTADVLGKAFQGDQASIDTLNSYYDKQASPLLYNPIGSLIADKGQEAVDLNEKVTKGYDDLGSQIANTAGNIVGSTAMLMGGGALGKAVGLAPQTAAAVAGTVSGGLNAAAQTNDPLEISEQAALNGLTSMVFSGVAGGLGKVAPVFKSIGANVLKNAGIGAIASWSSQTANKTLNNIYRLAKDENVTDEEWRNAFYSPEHLFSAIVSAIGYAAQGTIKDSKVVNSKTGEYSRAEDLKTLGLNENATDDDIAKAYRKLINSTYRDVAIGNDKTAANVQAYTALNDAKDRLLVNDYMKPSVIQKVKDWVNNLGKQTNNATVSDQALVPYSGTNAPTVTNQPIQVAQNTPETISNVPNITNQIANQNVAANNELPSKSLELTNVENSNKSSFPLIENNLQQKYPNINLNQNEQLLQNETKTVENEPILSENLEKSAENKLSTEKSLKTTEAINKETQTLNMESTPQQKERKHISTLAHAESIPDEVAKKITSNPRKYYTPQSNQETLNNAKEIIGEDYDRAEYRFLEKELGTAEDVAVADLLIQKAIANGDYNKAAELSVTLAEKLSKSGQVIQAASMIKRLTPDGMLIYAERQLNDFVNTIKKENPTWYNKLVKDGVISQGKGKPKIELTDNEKKTIVDNMTKAMDMKDGREKDVLVAKTLKIIGDKLPASTLEKVASLRRSGLLMNFKTLNRNLGSDVAFGALEAIKDIPATVIDKVASIITGQRTTALPNLKAAAKGFIEEGKYSLQDLYYGIDTTNGEGGKYELPSKTFKRTDSYKDIAKAFKNESIKVGAKKAFNRLLSDYEDAAMFFVNGTDRPFWRARFESELANQMKLNGLKYGEEAPTKEMAEIAKEAADYATFKNKNKLSSTLSGARMFLNNGKPLGLADAIGLTFTNVPGSVGSKIYDYTAGGYIKAIKELYNASRKNGQFNQKKFVDNLGRSLTGTLGIVALAGLIANGILTGSYDDDKDKADLEREMGIQKNAINFSALGRLIKGEDTTPKKGDVYYNYDWVQPVSGLAVLGTNLYNKATGGTKVENEEENLVSKLDDENEYYVKKKEDANWGDLAMEFLASTANQVVDMSSLGNLSDLFKGYNGLGENLTGAVGSFASSFIPTISNNIGQFSDETKRNTKDYTSEFKTNINKILNKLPGARETLEPSVNTLGEEKQQYVNGNDFASTFLNPGYYTTYNPSDIQQELMDVYNATGDKTIFPSTSPGTITYQNESVKLKPKGVTTFQKASGQYASELYDALLDDEFYKSLEPTDKAKVLKMVADDSRDVGKAAIGIQTKNYDTLDTDKYYLEKYDIPLETYYLAEFAMKNYKKNNTDASKRKAIREDSEGNKRFSNLDSEQLEMLYKIFDI